MIKDLLLLMPEILLALTLAGVVAAEVGYHGEKIRLVSGTALFGLFAALVHVALGFSGSIRVLLDGLVTIDGIALFFKAIFILLAVLVVMVSIFSKEIDENRRTEFYGFLVASALANCVLVSATDFQILFLALIFQTVVAFFLAAYDKRKALSSEAGAKFFAFSAVALAMLVYAAGLLYSKTQTFQFAEMREILMLQPLDASTGLVVFVLLFLPIAFSIGVFPMYFWVPDVVEGSPSPSSLYLCLALPFAGFVVAIRLFINIFGHLSFGWPPVVAFASAVTMLVGSLLAIRQTGAKRLLACLIVAHSGFMLMGLLVLTERGLSALFFNFVVEVLSLVGIFCCLSFFLDLLKSDGLKDLKKGVSGAIPECICLITFFATFVGLPPLPGFIGRFALVSAVVEAGWSFLAVAAVLSLVFGVIAFGKFAASLSGNFYTDWVPVAAGARSRGQRLFLFALLIPMLAITLFANVILEWTGRSARLILW